MAFTFVMIGQTSEKDLKHCLKVNGCNSINGQIQNGAPWCRREVHSFELYLTC